MDRVSYFSLSLNLWRLTLAIICICYQASLLTAAQVKFTEEERKVFRQRLVMNYDCMCGWMLDNGDPAMAAWLNQNRQATVDEWILSVEKVLNPNKEWFSPPASSPIQFGSSMAGVMSPLELAVKAGASDSEVDRISDRFQQRQQRHHSSFVGQIANVVDEELFLSAEQRRTLESNLMNRQPLWHDALLTFYENPMRYRMRPLAEQVPLGENFLTPTQSAHLKLTKADSHYYRLNIPPEAPLQTWRNVVEANDELRKPLIQDRLELQAAFLATSAHASHQKIRKLKLAALGTSDRLSRRYIQEQMAEFSTCFYEGSTDDFHLIFPTEWEISEESLWRRTISDWNSDPIFQQRESRIRDARVQYLVTVLDQELWLSENQRKAILPMIEKSIDRVVGTPHCQPSSRGHFFLWNFIWSAPREQLLTILTKQQVNAWNRLEECFDESQHGKLQYVGIKMIGGGIFVIGYANMQPVDKK